MNQVLFITGSLFNPVGGPYHSVRATALAFQKQGFKVSIIGTKDEPQQDSSAATYIKHPGIKVTALRKYGPYNMHFSFNFLSYWKAVKAADYISLQGVWMLNCLLVALFATVLRKPFYFAIRGEFNDPESLGSVDKRLIKPIVKILFNKADFIQVLNPREVNPLNAYGVKVAIKIIPNGIESPNGLGQVLRKKSVLYIGRIHPMKGLHELIDAWSKAELKGWSLIIAGDGEEAHKEEILKKASLQKSIEYVGPVRGAFKEDLLRESMWFALPSFMEGMPMAVLEAMSYGLPVLISEECNLPLVFTSDAGIKVDPDTESIYRGLKTIESLDSDIYNKFTLRAKKLVEEHFKWENAVNQLEKSFKTK